MARTSVSTKLLVSLLFSANILFAKDIAALIILSLMFLLMLLLTVHIDWKLLLKLTRGFIYIFCFTFSSHYFLQKNGLAESSFYSLRVMALIYFNAMIAASVTIDEFVNMFQHSMKRLPLSRSRVDRVVMVLKLTLNFIPVLKEEGLKVYRSQRVRGTNFKAPNMISRMNNYLSLIIPVLVSSIKKADDIALAMKARHFNGYMQQSLAKSAKGHGLTDFSMILITAFLTAANLYYIGYINS